MFSFLENHLKISIFLDSLTSKETRFIVTKKYQEIPNVSSAPEN